MGRKWPEIGADPPASDQTRSFQIAFDSPCAGKDRLVLRYIPRAATGSHPPVLANANSGDHMNIWRLLCYGLAAVVVVWLLWRYVRLLEDFM